MRNELTIAAMIKAERQKQISKGYDAEHDLFHTRGELMAAARAYQVAGYTPDIERPAYWPFEPEAWRPSDKPIENFVKAAALYKAAMERASAAFEECFMVIGACLEET